MTMLKPLVILSLAAFTLLLALCFHRLIQSQSSRVVRQPSDLEGDAILLTKDVRHLRRHLRHAPDPRSIGQEREQIRGDWLNMLLQLS